MRHIGEPCDLVGVQLGSTEPQVMAAPQWRTLTQDVVLLVFTQELLESLNTLTGAERDTSGLRVVEKEDAIPSTSTSTVPLLGEEEEAPETTRNRIQRDPEDETGDIRVHGTEETLPDPRSSPLAFSGDYTTLEMFQRGMPATTSGTQTTQSKPEETDSTGVTSGLDYIGQWHQSHKMFTIRWKTFQFPASLQVLNFASRNAQRGEYWVDFKKLFIISYTGVKRWY